MVIDAAKGIEAQTRKLFEVCRLRDIPIITFVNKMDREARDPFELLDEIADQLAIDVAPMMWPAGMGLNFKGVLRPRQQPHASCPSARKERGRIAPTLIEILSKITERQARTRMSSWRATALPGVRPRHPIAKAISRRSISARR